MKLARIAPLLLLSACSTSKTDAPLEAPDVKFKKAFIVAAIPSDGRKDVEERVAAEVQRRRPYVQVIPSYAQFPNPDEVKQQELLSFVRNHDIDMIITIVPFAETVLTQHDDWSDVAQDDVGRYVEDMSAQSLVGRYGVQVVGWEVATRKPVYAKTSQVIVGSVQGPSGVADFAIQAVTRDI